ncbi:AMIN-like domain-containing (lipo)protein [Corynebacterium diphtheriae]|nr:hypothetical protein FRC0435_00704 [Corynebacterium diphtheriae]CAB0927183.1 hypothetical protein FRC0434_00706 [Corynebacterium diphtheriae]
MHKNPMDGFAAALGRDVEASTNDCAPVFMPAYRRRTLPTARALVAVGTACLMGLVGCSNGSDAPDTVQGTAGKASLASSSTSSNAGLTPLGDASIESKTQRPDMSEGIVTSVRVGHHETFDRVVFDFEGTGAPGWFVDYTDSPAQQGSGFPIEIKGDAALMVNIDGIALPFELGKPDPQIGVVPGVGNITEVKAAGTFEGRSQFVVGLDRKHPYSVQMLREPTRVVIDIRSQS